MCKTLHTQCFFPIIRMISKFNSFDSHPDVLFKEQELSKCSDIYLYQIGKFMNPLKRGLLCVINYVYSCKPVTFALSWLQSYVGSFRILQDPLGSCRILNRIKILSRILNRIRILIRILVRKRIVFRILIRS